MSQKIKQLALEGTRTAGEYVRAQSVQEVPLDKGPLQESCEVSDNGKNTVFVSYDTPYALKQHEELGYSHPGGRKAKYLEDPFQRAKESGTIEKIIARSIREGL